MKNKSAFHLEGGPPANVYLHCSYTRMTLTLTGDLDSQT